MDFSTFFSPFLTVTASHPYPPLLSVPVEASPPKPHTQAAGSHAGDRTVRPPGHPSPSGLPPVLCSGLEDAVKGKYLPTDCSVLERKADKMKDARGS